MSQDTDKERKRAIVERVAKGRLELLDSIERVQQNASVCVSSLSSLQKPAMWGSVAGVGVLGALLGRRLAGVFRPRSAEVRSGGAIRSVAVQLVTLVLLPWLRRKMAEKAGGKDAKPLHGSLLSRLLCWSGSVKS